MVQDTIAALATPPGTGGIGIIRISGPRASEIARRLFKPGKTLTAFVSHRLYHGDIISLASGAVLDEALITLMKAPRSYTGEDTLEIYCHGSFFVLQSVLKEALAAGCRPAAPGEFTRRAFLNGRLDLAQAEAVSDLIMAKTEQGRKLALSHLKGQLSEKIETIRQEIVADLALLEAGIDFAEDEVSSDGAREAAASATALTEILGKLQALLSTYEHGKLLRHGASVVLAGKPNVGKSSLLNALLGEKRAIVTPLPGTTRDFIEEFINIAGAPFKLTDTAGIGPTADIVEREGIALVREKLALADLILLILDGSAGLAEEDRQVMAEIAGQPCLIVVNKADLPRQLDLAEVRAALPDTEVLPISAKYGEGLDLLKETIYQAVLAHPENGDAEVMITNLRHKSVLENTIVFLSQAAAGLHNRLPPELIAVELRDALASLGEMVEKTTNEEILEQIFSRFCIGK